jgi:hypothetical protein
MQPPSEDRFGKNMDDLAKFLVKEILETPRVKPHVKFPPALILIGLKYIQKKGNKNLVEGFIKQTYKFWDKIHEKDRDYLVENASDFVGPSVPKERLRGIVTVFSQEGKDGQKIISDDDTESLFRFLFALIRISILYIHETRQPVISKDEEGCEIKTYNHKEFEYVELNDVAKKWNVDLHW